MLRTLCKHLAWSLNNPFCTGWQIQESRVVIAGIWRPRGRLCRAVTLEADRLPAVSLGPCHTGSRSCVSWSESVCHLHPMLSLVSEPRGTPESWAQVLSGAEELRHLNFRANGCKVDGKRGRRAPSDGPALPAFALSTWVCPLKEMTLRWPCK